MADLGKILITPKGEYDPNIKYESLDLISYNGSSYLVLQDIKGITPSNDMINYMMSAQGYPGNASGVECNDTQSISGGGGISNVQSLIDILADKVVNRLVTNDNLNTKLNEYILKSMMSNININSIENIPTSALVYLMNNLITQNSNNIDSLVRRFVMGHDISPSKFIEGFTSYYINNLPSVWGGLILIESGWVIGLFGWKFGDYGSFIVTHYNTNTVSILGGNRILVRQNIVSILP